MNQQEIIDGMAALNVRSHAAYKAVDAELEIERVKLRAECGRLFGHAYRYGTALESVFRCRSCAICGAAEKAPQ